MDPGTGETKTIPFVDLSILNSRILILLTIALMWGGEASFARTSPTIRTSLPVMLAHLQSEMCAQRQTISDMHGHPGKLVPRAASRSNFLISGPFRCHFTYLLDSQTRLPALFASSCPIMLLGSHRSSRRRVVPPESLTRFAGCSCNTTANITGWYHLGFRARG